MRHFHFICHDVFATLSQVREAFPGKHGGTAPGTLLYTYWTSQATDWLHNRFGRSADVELTLGTCEVSQCMIFVVVAERVSLEVIADAACSGSGVCACACCKLSTFWKARFSQSIIPDIANPTTTTLHKVLLSSTTHTICELASPFSCRGVGTVKQAKYALRRSPHPSAIQSTPLSPPPLHPPTLPFLSLRPLTPALCGLPSTARVQDPEAEVGAGARVLVVLQQSDPPAGPGARCAALASSCLRSCAHPPGRWEDGRSLLQRALRHARLGARSCSWLATQSLEPCFHNRFAFQN